MPGEGGGGPGPADLRQARWCDVDDAGTLDLRPQPQPRPQAGSLTHRRRGRHQGPGARPFTAIRDYSYAHRGDIAAVHLPPSLAFVGHCAFAGCGRLTRVDFRSARTLAGLGYEAFTGCASLTSVRLPPSVEYVGDACFQDCGALAELELPAARLTAIENYVFRGCTQLAGLRLPGALASMGEGAFAGCRGLAALELPAALVSIGAGAFRGCDGIRSAVRLPAGLEAVAPGVFHACAGIPAVHFPPGLARIEENAFFACTFECGVAMHAHAPASTLPALRQAALLIGNTRAPVSNSNWRAPTASAPACTRAPALTFDHGPLWPGAGTGLTDLALPPALVDIANDAFADCSGITALYLPATLVLCHAPYLRSDAVDREHLLPFGVPSRSPAGPPPLPHQLSAPCVCVCVCVCVCAARQHTETPRPLPCSRCATLANNRL